MRSKEGSGHRFELHQLQTDPADVRSAESSSVSTLQELLDWRVRDRVKTVAAGLCLCLHLGVDPPDVLKPSPCARWECWVDPAGGFVQRTGSDLPNENIQNDKPPGQVQIHVQANYQFSTGAASLGPEKTREAIARNLQAQYEQWQPRVRYKACLDPVTEEVRKLCLSLRKSAKSERVLFHYNGHGVPKPTKNGELWVFNRQYTQYIPLNIADISAWLGAPSVWVLDCSSAAYLTQALVRASTDPTDVSGSFSASIPSVSSSSRDLVVFSACGCEEVLPFVPEMPADLLTSCLTTPLEAAIRWHCYSNGPLLPEITIDAALRIPGRLNDRRTPLGELNWIFTAITDTIAWLVLPRSTFRRLYRQDLLIASLARNYLLAQRILKAFYCDAHMHPPIPPTHLNSLWTLWDHVLDGFLAQACKKSVGAANTSHQSAPTAASSSPSSSSFFADQLDAMELWLSQHHSTPPTHINGPPDQLPSILQILLSQNLRPRALSLLARFCDFGPWACLECLHVGIHPYILKLLQTASNQPLVSPQVTVPLLHVWVRLMMTDGSCRNDLLRDPSSITFLCNCLPSNDQTILHEASAALALFLDSNAEGLKAIHEHPIVYSWIQGLSAPVDLWTLLLVAQLWRGTEGKGKVDGLLGGPLCRVISPALQHDNPLIRAAATYALGTIATASCEEALIEVLAELLCPQITDQSSLVRQQCLISLSVLVSARASMFRVLARDIGSNLSSFYVLVWKSILSLAVDAHDTIATLASRLVDELTVTGSFERDAGNEPSVSFASTSHTDQQPLDKRIVLQTSLPLPAHFLSYCLDQWYDPSRASDRNVSWVSSDKDWTCRVVAEERRRALRKTYGSAEQEAWQEKHLNTGSGSSSKKFDNQMALIDTGLNASISRLVLHPYEETLIVGDTQGHVTFWDWDWANQHPSTAPTHRRLFVTHEDAPLTSLSLFPSPEANLLLAASADGALRVYSSSSDVPVFAAQLECDTVVAEWSGASNAIVGCHDDQIHLIDLVTERLAKSWSTWMRPEREAVSLDCIHMRDGLLFCAGGGSISISDLGRGRAVSEFTDSGSASFRHLWSLNENILASATADGSVSLWDLRKAASSQPLVGSSTFISPAMTIAAHHPSLPALFASVSSDQYIKIGELGGAVTEASAVSLAALQTLRYHDGFLGQRLGSVQAVAFHPLRTLLAVASSDTVLSLHQPLKPRE